MATPSFTATCAVSFSKASDCFNTVWLGTAWCSGVILSRHKYIKMTVMSKWFPLLTSPLLFFENDFAYFSHDWRKAGGKQGALYYCRSWNELLFSLVMLGKAKNIIKGLKNRSKFICCLFKCGANSSIVLWCLWELQWLRWAPNKTNWLHVVLCMLIMM